MLILQQRQSLARSCIKGRLYNRRCNGFAGDAVEVAGSVVMWIVGTGVEARLNNSACSTFARFAIDGWWLTMVWSSGL